MGAVLLDTTVVIDLLRGRPGASRGSERFVLGRHSAHMCDQCRGDRAGLRAGDDPPARELFAGLRSAPLGDSEGWQAGEWRRVFAARGQTLTQADCLVAAAALSTGGRLATGNPRDFPMAELVVEHWPAGE